MCNLCAEFCNDLSVNLHETLLDKFVGFATRAYTGIAHELVETNLFVGIGQRHFIFNAFGARSEALATSGEHAALALHLSVGTLLVASLALLVSALTLLVTALALLVATLTLLITVV